MRVPADVAPVYSRRTLTDRNVASGRRKRPGVHGKAASFFLSDLACIKSDARGVIGRRKNIDN